MQPAVQELTKHFVQKDGIWRSSVAEAVFYPEERRDVCFELEEESFWFQHRNKCIKTIFERYTPQGIILDVGGGNGCVTKMLDKAGYSVILVEPSFKGCENARQRGVEHVVCAPLEKLSFDRVHAGAVCFFDVIEHLEDESALLRQAHSILNPGGKLYVTVPAHSWLWSWHDELAGHFRRHNKKSLTQTLESNGFQILYLSYFFGALTIPAFLFRRLPYLMGMRVKTVRKDLEKKQHVRSGPVSKLMQRFILEPEQRVLASSEIKTGTSIIAVAVKA